MSAEAHSFDIGAADPSSDPYLVASMTHGGIFQGSMSQISSLQTIPTAYNQIPQLYHHKSTDSLHSAS